MTRFCAYAENGDRDLMGSPNAFWIALPADMQVTQFSVGSLISLPDGRTVAVESMSTTRLLVRPLHWWERLWKFVKLRRVEETK